MYGALGRPLTFVEICGGIPPELATPEDVARILERGVARGQFAEEEGFYSPRARACGSFARRTQDLLRDHKWKKLESLARWFRHIPFVEFVFVSGSISMGNVHERSDFDVVTGVRAGRIFMTRYFVSALFSLLNARRLDDLQESSPDKLCFNHFVTEATYEKEPHNYYRGELYRNLVPLWGDEETLSKFISKNAWARMPRLALLDAHRIAKGKSVIARALERLFSGKLGDVFEARVARPIAMKRLHAYLARKGEGERVVIGDAELEFHFVLNYEKQFSTLTR